MTAPPIFFVINSLAGGGAERVMVQLLSGLTHLSEQSPCHLVLLDDEPSEYDVPGHIIVHQLASNRSLLRGMFGLSRLVSRHRPIGILSFLTRANVSAALVGRMFCTPVVISERVHTSSHLGTGWASTLTRFLVRLAYPMAGRVVAVSKGVAEELTSTYGVAPGRIDVVHNPIQFETILENSREAPEIDLPTRFGVAVGRLEANKRVDLLLRSYHQSGIASDLVVLGDGSMRAELQALVTELGIANRVHLSGFVRNPFAIVGRAQFYVSASSAEGFPNALVEAMALGVPAIHTDCPSGAGEILSDPEFGPAGILVPTDDVDTLAAAMRELDDPGRRASLGAAAARRVRDFSPEEALARYEQILNEACQISRMSDANPIICRSTAVEN